MRRVTKAAGHAAGRNRRRRRMVQWPSLLVVHAVLSYLHPLHLPLMPLLLYLQRQLVLRLLAEQRQRHHRQSLLQQECLPRVARRRARRAYPS